MKVLEHLLQDAATYLNIDEAEIRRRFEEAERKYPGYLKWTHVSEEDWLARGINQDSPHEVAAFYGLTDNYILELIEANSSNDKRRLTKTAVEFLINHGCLRTVDYGVGIGEDVLEQKRAGLEVTAADIPGKTFSFAQWRFNKQKFQIPIINLQDGRPSLDGKYDGITCFEVIQHVVDPVGLVRHFYQHLNPQGLFLMTARFRGNYALALKKNEAFHGVFSEAVQGVGFRLLEKVHMWGPESSDGKYLEVYEK